MELDEATWRSPRAASRHSRSDTPDIGRGPAARTRVCRPPSPQRWRSSGRSSSAGRVPAWRHRRSCRLRGQTHAAPDSPAGTAAALAWSPRRRVALGVTTAYLDQPGGPGAAGRAATVAASAAAATARLPAPAGTTAAARISGTAAATIALEPDARVRVRQHPYVRLALNGSFSALWAGQLISLFGDRLNQLALVAVVLVTTGSALATGLVFFVATLPNLLLSPIAGTFVDRWDHKEVMVVSDILRAALVLLIPVAATVNILLVYPLIFLVTTSRSSSGRPGSRSCRGSCPRRTAQRELGDVGRRDDRRRHRLPAGRHLRRAASGRGAARVLGRRATYLASAALLATIVVRGRNAIAPSARRRRHPASSPSCRPAGASSAARRSCWRTPSRARSASSASASRSP